MSRTSTPGSTSPPPDFRFRWWRAPRSRPGRRPSPCNSPRPPPAGAELPTSSRGSSETAGAPRRPTSPTSTRTPARTSRTSPSTTPTAGRTRASIPSRSRRPPPTVRCSASCHARSRSRHSSWSPEWSRGWCSRSRAAVGEAARRLALDHAERDEAGDATGEARALGDADHLFDVLVRARRLLGDPFSGRRPHDDPFPGERAGHFLEAERPHRGGAREPAARPVARGPERSLHRGRKAPQNVARRAHVARNEHRLAVGAVGRRYFLAPGGEGPRRSLAMNEHALAAAVDPVLFDLRHVVGNVVDDGEVEFLLALVEHRSERATHPVGDRLAVRPREVRAGRHRPEVATRRFRIHRRARQLPVDERDSLAGQTAVHLLDVVGGDLVAEAPGTGVEHDGDATRLESEHRREFGEEDPVDRLHFEEVVPGPEGAELLQPPFVGPVRDGRGKRAGEAPLLLLDREVFAAPESLLD